MRSEAAEDREEEEVKEVGMVDLEWEPILDEVREEKLLEEDGEWKDEDNGS